MTSSVHLSLFNPFLFAKKVFIILSPSLSPSLSTTLSLSLLFSTDSFSLHLHIPPLISTSQSIPPSVSSNSIYELINHYNTHRNHPTHGTQSQYFVPNTCIIFSPPPPPLILYIRYSPFYQPNNDYDNRYNSPSLSAL